MRRSLLMIALWAVLGVVAMGAGIAAVSSAQQAVGQVAVEPLSEEQVEQAVAVGDSDDLPLPTVSGLPGASPTVTKKATPTPSRSADDDAEYSGGSTSQPQTTAEPGDDNGGYYEDENENEEEDEEEHEEEHE